MPEQYEYLNNVKADIRLLGVPNIFSSFCQFDSAPRIGMLNHHLPQTMIIAEPEFNKIFTGAENSLIEHTFNSSKRDYDCEIVAIVPKYQASFINQGFDNCPQVYVIVLTIEPNGVRHLDYFTIDRYFMGTNGFGFIPNVDNLHRIKTGEYLDKDTPITQSGAVKGNQYCLGTNLNIVYGSFPETIEDAFIISQTAARKLQTTQVSQVTINCRQDRRPLNLYGGEFEEKFLPDIGSIVRPDGALCAFRPVHWTTCVADSDPVALREPLPLQDDIVYIEPGSKVVDITFNINRSKLNNCYDQAQLYMQNNTKCWEAIYATYLKYKGKFNCTPKMDTLVTTAIYRMIAQGARVPSLEAEFRKEMKNFDIEGSNGQVVEFIQAIVTYTAPRAVSNGDKLTDFHGSKGVVGNIYPDDWMPIDEYGIRADMWIDMNSPVARNNPGQLYETGINRISEFVRREVERINISSGAEDAFNTLMSWYGDVNPNYEKRIRDVCKTVKDRKGIVKDAIETSPKIWIPPFLDTMCPSDDEFWNALVNIKKWATKWNVKSSPITYRSLQRDGSGKQFTTRDSFSIGSKYIIHLHKLPEIFAPGPAAVSHIGIPTKSAYEAKYFPVSVNPNRYGEDELRVISMDTDVREVVRLQNLLSNSPEGVSTVIQSLLTAPHPSRIKRISISNGQLQKTSAVLRLFHNTAATLGLETKNTRISHLDVSDELTDSIWMSDIVEYNNNPPSIDGSGTGKKAVAKRDKMKRMIDTMISDNSDEEDVDESNEDSDE